MEKQRIMGINYQQEFSQRTVEVLEKGYELLKGIGREVTFLMNCLLGTVVVISEKEDDKRENSEKQNEFLAGTIDEEFFRKLGIPIKTELIGQDKLRLITNIRHGIAHQHIEAKNDSCTGGADTIESNWSGVKIKNDYQGNNFEIEFGVTELRNFAINLTKRYAETENPH
jgi:hypothetical protein